MYLLLIAEKQLLFILNLYKLDRLGENNANNTIALDESQFTQMQINKFG